jgi:hypothetical protein
MAMAYAGLRAGLTFLNAQTELGPREAAVVALAAEARNGAKAAAGSKADEIAGRLARPWERRGGAAYAAAAPRGRRKFDADHRQRPDRWRLPRGDLARHARPYPGDRTHTHWERMAAMEAD